MPGAVRDMDITSGTCSVGADCCPHSRCGINTEVSDNVFINGLGARRVGDIGDCRCPHGGSYKSEEGSGTVFINGRPAVRIGDMTKCTSCGCTGTHVTGSDNVFIN